MVWAETRPAAELAATVVTAVTGKVAAAHPRARVGSGAAGSTGGNGGGGGTGGTGGSGGTADGGAISNGGNLTITNTVFSNDQATGGSGGTGGEGGTGGAGGTGGGGGDAGWRYRHTGQRQRRHGWCGWRWGLRRGRWSGGTGGGGGDGQGGAIYNSGSLNLQYNEPPSGTVWISSDSALEVRVAPQARLELEVELARRVLAVVVATGVRVWAPTFLAGTAGTGVPAAAAELAVAVVKGKAGATGRTASVELFTTRARSRSTGATGSGTVFMSDSTAGGGGGMVVRVPRAEPVAPVRPEGPADRAPVRPEGWQRLGMLCASVRIPARPAEWGNGSAGGTGGKGADGGNGGSGGDATSSAFFRATR